MKLRQVFAAPFGVIASLIDPPPPPTTFWERLIHDAGFLQSLINTAHTTLQGVINVKQVNLEAARTTHLERHVEDLAQRFDKLDVERLLKEGIKDPLPRPGEVLGDYIARLAAARIGGLLWVWQNDRVRWAALDHHISVDNWTPEKGVGAGSEAADVIFRNAGRPPAPAVPGAPA